jgi:hypothetical protein
MPEDSQQGHDPFMPLKTKVKVITFNHRSLWPVKSRPFWVQPSDNHPTKVISGFCHDTDEICALLGYYVV